MTSPAGVLDARINVRLGMAVAPLADIRNWLTGALVGLGEEHTQDLMLICTELVANAYDHADAPRRLRVHRSPDVDAVRVEVEDSSPDRLPTVGVSSAGRFRGRGLVMVDTLSTSRWGVHLANGGKTVWAELPLS